MHIRRISVRTSPHPLTANDDAFAAQQVTQHPAARERVVQMQRVDPSHDR